MVISSEGERAPSGALGCPSLQDVVTARKMGDKILECPIHAFLNHYAPFHPSNQSVTAAFNQLQGASLLKIVGQGANKAWAFADTTEPIDEAESTIFKILEKAIHILQSGKTKDGVRSNRLFFYNDCSSNNITPVTPTTLSDVAAIVTFMNAEKSKDIEDVSSCSPIQAPETDVFF